MSPNPVEASAVTSGRLLVDVPEARRMLGGIGTTHFYALVRRGDVQLVHLGRRSFVAVKQLERLIDTLLAEAQE